MSPRKENYKSKNLLENSDTHSLNGTKSLGREHSKTIGLFGREEPLRIAGEKDQFRKEEDFKVRDLLEERTKLNLSRDLGELKSRHIGRIDTFGCYDFETFTLEDGLQRAYYLLVYHPLKGYTHFKRCDYLNEIQFNNAILKFFRDNPSIYFSFNGRNFDHLILNRILNQSGVKPFTWIDKSKIRKLSWFNNTFLDILYWTHPCTLRDLSKTFLREDLKDPFPHSIVSLNMILSKNSKFVKLDEFKDFKGDFKDFKGELKERIEEFKDFKEESNKAKSVNFSRFEGKEFWPLVESYILKDVQILYRCLLELDRLYINEIGYSIVDNRYHGLASISYDFVLKFIDKEDLVPFTREQQERWKSCLTGGIVEVLDLNLKQEVIHKYDINGLYVRFTQDFKYPIGEPEVILNPSVSDLPNLFGLIKAYV
uniref:DNA-directed DNA polymerase n=1 Tax=Glomus sp. DAOM 240422 TaxID=1281822 RepID=S4UK76_9GLOM|nr:truncated plasmid-related DNA polymerase [Glomus sp. DAOM 240422]